MTGIEEVLANKRSWHVEHTDVLEGLRALPDGCVHTVVTSPPYWGLRDYGTGTWEGGAADCHHVERQARNDISPEELARRAAQYGTGTQAGSLVSPMLYRNVCGKCGARRIDKGIGLEADPAEFIARMVEVFAEVHRVLHPTGTLWLNMGDSYWNGGAEKRDGGHGFVDGGKRKLEAAKGALLQRPCTTDFGLKPKDLMMMPARVALALQDAGWILRSEITWCKRAPMPESCTDRPTSATEKIYLFAKRGAYFYDQEAVREKFADERMGNPGAYNSRTASELKSETGRGRRYLNIGNEWNTDGQKTGRNMWSYWLLSPEPFPAAHFATFPTEIPRRAILAGSSERGVCPECGAPWKRVVEREGYNGAGRANGHVYTANAYAHPQSAPRGPARDFGEPTARTTGWTPTCTHQHDPIPALVLDCFSGAGTTGLVARRLGRRYLGLELNAEYVRMSEDRLAGDAPLLEHLEEQARAEAEAEQLSMEWGA